MRVGLSETTYTQTFDAQQCREEKEKILEDMCITLDAEEKYQLSKLTTARQMDQFVITMVNKHWR